MLATTLEKLDLSLATHPTYNQADLLRYRLTYDSGDEFISRYLERYYNEKDDAFVTRKKLTYVPSYAREAVEELARAITQRSFDIRRMGGADLFRKQCEGLSGGVDRHDSTMSGFFSKHIIAELMAMGSVGIYVENDEYIPYDRPSAPYLVAYRAEDIRNWDYAPDGSLNTLLLRYFRPTYNAMGLPTGTEEVYRYMVRTMAAVTEYGVFYDPPEGMLISEFVPRILVRDYVYSNNAHNIVMETLLDLEQIPFVRIALPFSLLKHTARHQIALLNVASSNLYYAFAANFPLFTQQYSPSDIQRFMANQQTAEGDNTGKAPGRQISVGPMSGIEYPIGSDRPQWIAPPEGPFVAAMKKEEQIKTEIRDLTTMALAKLPQMVQSAEISSKNREDLESGLSVIGMILNTAETALARHWHAYKGLLKEITQISYPRRYELRSNAERRAEAKELDLLASKVPSQTYRRLVSKQLANILHGHQATNDELDQIMSEIDAAKAPTSDPDILRSDVENGLVSVSTASMARGYDPAEAEQAKIDHAERLARIAFAQSNFIQGVPDSDPAPGLTDNASKKQSQSPDLGKSGRGEAKKIHGAS